MGAITVHAKVDANGVLRLELPLGRSAAGRDVRIVVDEPAEASSTDAERYSRIRALASGCVWPDTSELPPLLPLEKRDEL